jgi:hypothetical protein
MSPKNIFHPNCAAKNASKLCAKRIAVVVLVLFFILSTKTKKGRLEIPKTNC